MSDFDQFEKAVALWVLGQVPSDDLPAVAIDGLVKGLDSPLLRQLSAKPSTAQSELHTMFSKALIELEIPEPSLETAMRFLATSYAQQVDDEIISPIEGAIAILFLSTQRGVLVEEYKSLRILSGEWEDTPNLRPFFDEAIRAECKRILQIAQKQ